MNGELGEKITKENVTIRLTQHVQLPYRTATLQKMIMLTRKSRAQRRV